MPDFPTFTLTDAHDDELTIGREFDARTEANVATVKSSGDAATYVQREESPAVALAVLEAAGARMLDGTVAQAIVSLRAHLEYRAAERRREEAEREAREAKAREELDAATLDAYNAFRLAAPLGFKDRIASLDELPAQVVAAWREAVKTARASS